MSTLAYRNKNSITIKKMHKKKEREREALRHKWNGMKVGLEEIVKQ